MPRRCTVCDHPESHSIDEASLKSPERSGYDTPTSGVFGAEPGFGKRSPYASAVLAPNPKTGDVPKADLLGLLRDASRFFGASVSDEVLVRYVR